MTQVEPLCLVAGAPCCKDLGCKDLSVGEWSKRKGCLLGGAGAGGELGAGRISMTAWSPVIRGNSLPLCPAPPEGRKTLPGTNR